MVGSHNLQSKESSILMEEFVAYLDLNRIPAALKTESKVIYIFFYTFFFDFIMFCLIPFFSIAPHSS